MAVNNSPPSMRIASGRFAVAAGGLALFDALFMAHALLEAYRDHRASGTVVMHTIFLLPGAFYLWGLIALTRFFRGVASGKLFEPQMAQALTSVGWALIGSGIVSVIGVPAFMVIARTMNNVSDPAAPLGQPARIDMSYLILIVVGMALLAVTKLIKIAAEYRDTNSMLRSEIDEFL